jgi:hypothetical protein
MGFLAFPAFLTLTVPWTGHHPAPSAKINGPFHESLLQPGKQSHQMNRLFYFDELVI